jgi:hypothetical protein
MLGYGHDDKPWLSSPILRLGSIEVERVNANPEANVGDGEGGIG